MPGSAWSRARRPEPPAMSGGRTLPFDYPAPAAPLPGEGLPWLDALRAQARAAAARGLPGPRSEAWKYTNLAPLAALAFAAPGAPAAADAQAPEALPPGAFAAVEGACLTFVNGRLSPARPAPDAPPAGLRLAGLAQSLKDDPASVERRLGEMAPLDGGPMAAFNTAFAADGCLLEVARGAVVERPVLLRFVAAPGAGPLAWHPRVILHLEAGARLALVESHEGPDGAATWSNPVVDIRLGEGACLDHVKLQAEGAGAYHTALTEAVLAGGARYGSLALALGARLSRNEIHVRFAGVGAECRLDGGYMARGIQHVDNTTAIDHAAPGCTSREVYKGVLDDRARGVFQGKIVVRKDARKTDGHQLGRALLLSPEAEVDTKPELEIYADDVKCGHGATAGAPEEDQLFYLRSRGLDARTARALIVEGFMAELLEAGLLETAEHAPVRAALAARIGGWVAEGGAV